MGVATSVRPSFGMTKIRDIRNLFSYHILPLLPSHVCPVKSGLQIQVPLSLLHCGSTQVPPFLQLLFSVQYTMSSEKCVVTIAVFV